MYLVFLKQVGNELKSVRNRKNLTLEQASDITKIHKNTLSVYENHPQYLKLGRLFDILEKYNCDADIFFSNVCEYINKEHKEEI